MATRALAVGCLLRSRNSFLAFAADSANDGILTVGELMDDASIVSVKDYSPDRGACEIEWKGRFTA